MKTIIRIYKEAKKWWVFIAIATIAMLAVTAVNLITPRLTQNMIAVVEKDFTKDDLIPSSQLLLYCFPFMH